MRLIDKWAINSRAKTGQSPPPSIVSFVVDNIARDYYHDERDWFEPKDYPYSIPPWPVCFVEWNEPPTMRKGGAVYAIPGSQVGALVIDIPDRARIDAASELIEKTCELGDGKDDTLLKIRSASRGFVALLHSEFSCGQFLNWDIRLFVFTDADGMVLVNCKAGHGLNRSAAQGPAARKSVTDMCDSIGHILGLAFTFSHCKNVKTIDATKELKPKDKIERRLKIPSFRRYTLQIDGRQTSRNGSCGIGASPSYHLCRGHFATYTAERPLFGKLTGRFWIPAHTKGKRERGEVVKDYETTSDRSQP